MLRWLLLPLAMLCVGCAASDPALNQAPATHAFDLDGTSPLDGETIRYVVPNGYCLLDSNRAPEAAIYGNVGEELEDEFRAFALYADCDQLETFRTTDEGLMALHDVGGYAYLLEDDGKPTKGGMARARFAREVTALQATEDDEELVSTGYTEDAAYFSFSPIDPDTGAAYPMLGALGVTLVYDNVIALIMFQRTDDPAALPALGEEVRALVAAFLDANPDTEI